MRKREQFTIVASLLAVLAVFGLEPGDLAAAERPLGLQHGAPAGEQTEAEFTAEVKAFLAHYLKVLEAKDEAGIARLYVDDERFTWFTDGALVYSSTADVLAALNKYRDMAFRTEPADLRVLRVGSEHASVTFSFATRMTIPGAEDYEFGGVISMLLERGDRGWRVLVGHTSTPGGPVGGAEEEGR